MTEPRWRTALCWGAVLAFLTLPLIVFVLLVISDEYPALLNFREHVKEYRFLTGYYESVTALVFGLAGLNTLDRHSERKNGDSHDSAGDHNQNSKP